MMLNEPTLMLLLIGLYLLASAGLLLFLLTRFSDAEAIVVRCADPTCDVCGAPLVDIEWDRMLNEGGNDTAN